MSRIAALAPDATPAAARPLLEAVTQKLGRLPNMLAILANSPAALEGYLALDGALRQGALSAQMRERIALAMAEINGCNYCLSAHVYFARHGARLDDAEITANRNGASNDPKADAALRFAAALARSRGGVSYVELARFKDAGYGDAEAVEIAALVALNTLTNTVNKLAGTEIDFPPIASRAAA
jgi:uncharacterized peroxidase-related enzyme